jgi:hypothetical protein
MKYSYPLRRCHFTTAAWMFITILVFTGKPLCGQMIPSRVEISGDVLGKHYTAFLLPSDVTNTPPWTATHGENPPVSVQEAVRLAQRALPGSLPDASAWSVGEIQLSQWPDPEHWSYKINLDGPSHSKITIAVLMNGHAICPRPETKSDDDKTKLASMSVYGDYRGRRYFSIVRLSDLSATPLWFGDGDKPPVSAGEAVNHASKALVQLLGNVADWKPTNVSLFEWPASGHWIYKVQFDGPVYEVTNSTPNTQSQSVMMILVLMDGHAVVPEPAKENSPRQN